MVTSLTLMLMISHSCAQLISSLSAESLPADLRALYVNFDARPTFLTALQSAAVTDFSGTAVRQVNGREVRLVACNPSLVLTADGFLLNLRFVNYNLTQFGQYLPNEKFWTSVNKALLLDRSLRVVREHWFDQVAPSEVRFQGVEDVRLMDHFGRLIFSGTVFPTQASRTQYSVGVGAYDFSRHQLSSTPLSSPSNSREEKNWAFFHRADGALFAVHTWAPLTVISVWPTVEVNAVQTAVPELLRHMRGSSNGARVGGSEIWFVTHVVLPGNGLRDYLHFLVVLDAETLQFRRHSKAFKFAGALVEFALSLVVTSETVMFSFSQWDRTAAVLSINRSVVNDLFAVHKL